MKLIVLNRRVHKWAGIVLAVLITVIGITGVVLIHKRDLPVLGHIGVPNFLVPSARAKEGGQDVKFLGVDPASDRGALAIGTKTGLTIQKEDAEVPVDVFSERIEVRSMLFLGQMWLMGTHRGLYQSRDRGQTWQRVTEGLPYRGRVEIRVLRRDVQNPQTVWMGAKTGVFRSLDGGNQWENLSWILPSDHKARDVETIAFDPEQRHVVFLGTHRGAYRYDQRTEKIKALLLEPVGKTSAGRPVGLDQYIEDLHTGKLFGGRLWMVYDLVAISLIAFVATGFYMWIYPWMARGKRRSGA